MLNKVLGKKVLIGLLLLGVCSTSWADSDLDVSIEDLKQSYKELLEAQKSALEAQFRAESAQKAVVDSEREQLYRDNLARIEGRYDDIEVGLGGKTLGDFYRERQLKKDTLMEDDLEIVLKSLNKIRKHKNKR